jgi:hypothetical protein
VKNKFDEDLKVIWACDRLREYANHGNEGALEQVVDWMRSLEGGERETREQWTSKLREIAAILARH